jgi:hypothetical protein
MRPRRYRIVVAGELSRRFALAFDGMTMRCGNGQTVLTGTIVDQAHMHGLLNQLGELGLDLVSLASIEDDPGQKQQRDRAAASPRVAGGSR